MFSCKTPVFLRGEEIFTASPWRLYGNTQKVPGSCVGVKIFYNIRCAVGVTWVSAMTRGVFSVFSFQLIKMAITSKTLVSIKNIVIIYI